MHVSSYMLHPNTVNNIKFYQSKHGVGNSDKIDKL